MKKPSIIINVGHQHLLAYMLYPDGNAELVERVEFMCDGQTDCPMVDWNNEEEDPYRPLAEIIDGILTRYHPKEWGLVGRTDQCPKIREHLPSGHLKSLAGCIEDDSVDINISNVAEYFTGDIAPCGDHI